MAASSIQDEKAKRLLQRAGYTGSGGLGKRAQGRLEPVVANDQIDRAGIGFARAVKRSKHEYQPATIDIRTKVQWLDMDPEQKLPANFDGWQTTSSTNNGNTTHCCFCDPKLQQALEEAKATFDTVPRNVFCAARDRANPFELLKREWLQNRSALKMAELDAVCDRVFTQPPSTRSMTHPSVWFADICAGPGGFSEYMLTACGWRAQGFGFTLCNRELDFQLRKFNRCASTETFRAYYGADGTGDITRSANVRHFITQVVSETDRRGVHVALCDGGFDVQGREQQQEQLSQPLLVCQLAMSCGILQRDGVLLCKVFDTFLPITIECLWILRQHFARMAIIKPNQSRPANSERYIVCTGYRLNPQSSTPLVGFLLSINDTFKQRQNNKDVAQLNIVPVKQMERDRPFCEYVTAFNETNARHQHEALLRIRAYIEDTELPTDPQEAIREQCLAYWGWQPSTPSFPRADTAIAPCMQQVEEKKATSDDALFIEYDNQAGQYLFDSATLAQTALCTDMVRDMYRTLCAWKQTFQEFQSLAAAKDSKRLADALGKVIGSQYRDKQTWEVMMIPEPIGRMMIVSRPDHRLMALTANEATLQAITDDHPLANLRVPNDTALDVVEYRDDNTGQSRFVVIDAFSLPGRYADVAMWRTRPFLSRLKWVDVWLHNMRMNTPASLLRRCIHSSLTGLSLHTSHAFMRSNQLVVLVHHNYQPTNESTPTLLTVQLPKQDRSTVNAWRTALDVVFTNNT